MDQKFIRRHCPFRTTEDRDPARIDADPYRRSRPEVGLRAGEHPQHRATADIDLVLDAAALERQGNDPARNGVAFVRGCQRTEHEVFRPQHHVDPCARPVLRDERQAMPAAVERNPDPTLAVALLDAARKHIRRAEESRDEQAFRPLIDVGRRPFLHDTALVHDRDPVGEGEGLDLVVGDEQGGHPDLPNERGQLAPHAVAQPRVKIGQRLVQQKQAWPPHDRARQRNALLLPAREPRRRAARHGLQPDQREHVGDALLDLRTRDARPLHFERIGDIVEHVEMRPDRIGLKHHSDRALVHGDEAVLI